MSVSASNQFNTGHIGLNVTNLARSSEFYQKVFDFEAIYNSEAPDRPFVFLGDGQRIVLTLWQQSQGHFEKNQPGLHHLSFEVKNIEQVKAFEQKLRALNIPLFYEGIVPHLEGSASGGIYFEDPDGIRLEINSPTGAEDYSAPVTDAPSCGFF